jgi:hypothetical protein
MGVKIDYHQIGPSPLIGIFVHIMAIRRRRSIGKFSLCKNDGIIMGFYAAIAIN